MVQEALGIPVTAPVRIPVFLVGLGDEAIRSNQILASRLRKSGIPVVAECESRSMKSQMRSADRTGAAWVLIRGENELSSGMIVCKNMVSGEQMTVELEKAIELVRDKIG
jgi:histidyl-tRNA synthetase